MKLRIYDEKGKNVVREVEAEEYDITFGVVIELMELLKIDDNMNSIQVIAAAAKTWDELTGILDNIFPNVTREEWKTVKLKELIPLIMWIVRKSISEMLKIPGNGKNLPGE